MALYCFSAGSNGMLVGTAYYSKCIHCIFLMYILCPIFCTTQRRINPRTAGMDVSEVLGSNAAQAMGFQLFAPIDNTVILSNGGTPAQGK